MYGDTTHHLVGVIRSILIHKSLATTQQTGAACAVLGKCINTANTHNTFCVK